jgi:hypothetical protein
VALPNFGLVLWLLLCVVGVGWMQSRVTRHAQLILLLLIRNEHAALLAFQVLFLPGVALHEGSHWIVARVLGMRDLEISLWPQRQRDGSVRLGYVKTEHMNFARAAFVGTAPLVAGIAVVTLISARLGLGRLWMAAAAAEAMQMRGLLAELWLRPDLWLWVYLLFACSNTMLPSASDRRALPAAAAVLGGLALGGYLLGMLPLVRVALGGVAWSLASAANVALCITILLDLLLLPLLYLLEALLWRLRGGQLLRA